MENAGRYRRPLDYRAGGSLLLHSARQAGHSDIRLYEFSTGKIRKSLTIERGISEQIAVSPDGRTILYTQLDEAGSELMLVENFR